ncbi:LOW QUALITY PROTEIN: TBC domain-containing protein kinase-like protein [Dermatophagoides farinae]|uniref:LOW QUALITY PROTEIN: TBC domain-containing protein kinase-like protein n=1 Tax=Dermatophagoides farinae TaxID=6954 RepID=UPI003F5F63B5
MVMKLSDNYKLATVAFESTVNQNDMFGTNGLPLTPPSITMIGNFHSFVHSFNAANTLTPYLTHYLDCIRSKNERITLVFEHYASCVAEDSPISNENLQSILQCGLYGLYHLHYVIGAVHGLISPSAFLTTNDQKIPYKLTHWAINIITDMGRLCQTRIYPNDIRFISPEQCLLLKPTKKSDIWSFGLSILYLMFPNQRQNFPYNPLELIDDSNGFNSIMVKLGIEIKDLSEKWMNFFQSTLNPNPNERLSIKELIAIMAIPEPQYYTTYEKFIKTKSYQNVNEVNDEEFFKISNFINLHEFYYLWSIAYPSKETNKEEQKIPTILSIPKLVILENECSNQDNCDSNHNRTVPDDENNLIEKIMSIDLETNWKMVRLPSNCDFKLLPVDTINQRLLKLSSEIFSPLLISDANLFNNRPESKQSCESLPLPIREMDFDYQCERLFLFKALLNGYPFLRNQLITESKSDICPHYRAQIWCSLLNVRWKDKLLFEQIDKISKTTTDRQIAVDIPRCHQYNDLLASAEGHRKLTRILKAWLAYNESNGEVYWQGLDSLAAPFVILNFNNESQAFACFDHFVRKYLHGFFQKDNSAAIQEYLALFQVIIAFHDPVLSNHLASLKFVPDLYAISWFLTMFTHILPLYQIFQLWDTLILGNESFPLFIGLAILHQLRDRILDFTFNDCILIFSDLPQIDIDRCVRNSIKFFCSTPKSISRRNLWEIHALKKYPRLPRINIEDLTILVDRLNLSNCTATAVAFDQQQSLCSDCGRNTQLVLIDCRSKDDISKYGGTLINSVRYEDFYQELQKEITNGNKTNRSTKCHYQQPHGKHDLIIVIDSIEKTLELIENFSIPRVCYLDLSSSDPGYIPKCLLIQ